MKPDKTTLVASLNRPTHFARLAIVAAWSLVYVACFFCSAVSIAQDQQARPAEMPACPNVLWLTAEDIGPHLGCYGDSVARTPNLDALAAKGMIYKRAWSNYPVCAPARTTIITGLYASSSGAGNMRSRVPLDSDLRMFPQYLRDAGYFCTNNSKEDYNTTKPEKVWDLSNRKADYGQRPKAEQSFFAVMNQSCSHEGKIRTNDPPLTTDPAAIELAPYYPDSPVVRKDWARYYDNIARLDDWVGEELQRLEQSGNADNTIVFFFGDHGSGMPRHKRFAGDSGMRVPMIVYVPEKLRHLSPADYMPGSKSDRLVGFVDLAPTMLSLAGIEPPKEMQGNPFMGAHQTEPAKYLYGYRDRMDERNDCSRSITDGRYIYIRNYMPHLPHGQFVEFQQKTATTETWNRMFREGMLNEVQSAFFRPKQFEELYDLQADPHETQNLCLQTERDEQTDAALKRLRAEHSKANERFGDAGLIPEPLLAKLDGISAYDAIRTAKFSGIQAAAERATHPSTSLDELFQMASETEKLATVHWASVGILLQGAAAVANHKPQLYELLNNPVSTVRVNVAETLAAHGDQADLRRALEVLLEISSGYEADYYAAIWAINAIDRLADKAEAIGPQLKKIPRESSDKKRGKGYINRLIDALDRER